MELATTLSARTHCVKAQVGAVIARDTRIISIGYNGPPSGTHNCDEEWPETGCPRDSRGSCSLALHAEENAIIYAVRNGTSLDGTTLYTTLSHCLSCARLIRSEEHTSELQSLMRISYAVVCLKKKKNSIKVIMLIE